MRAVILSLILTLAGGSVAAQNRVLRWAHAYKPTETYHLQAVEAGNEIARLTNGRIKVEVFPESKLGGEETYGAKLAAGEIDIAYYGTNQAGRDYSRIGISGYPFIFQDTDHVRRYLASPLFQEILDGYQAKTGNRMVTGVYYGARNLTSNKLLRTPQDMAGIKLRVPFAPNYKLFAEALGAVPTPISFPKVYEALKNNEVDAQENPLPTIMAQRFYEVHKYTFLTQHIHELSSITIAGPTWKSLSPADQKSVEAAIRKHALWASVQTISNELTMEAELRKNGMVLIPVDRKAFREAVLRNAKPSDINLTQEDYDRLAALASRRPAPLAQPASPEDTKGGARPRKAVPAH
jgi:tripartite ATP-independent transporter DctP family solute receptor